jgi:hypothetical protein
VSTCIDTGAVSHSPVEGEGSVIISPLPSLKRRPQFKIRESLRPRATVLARTSNKLLHWSVVCLQLLQGRVQQRALVGKVITFQVLYGGKSFDLLNYY